MYSTTGGPSGPPEQLLRALLFEVLYRVRSERLLMEELDYNLLFRWFEVRVRYRRLSPMSSDHVRGRGPASTR